MKFRSWGTLLLVSLFFAVMSGCGADRNKLTKERVRETFLEFLGDRCNASCTVEVQGVLEVSQQNIARADAVVSNVKLQLPKNDAVTAYAFGPGGGTRLWDGRAQLHFVHYNDGGWVLTRIDRDDGRYWDGLNVVVRQQAAGGSQVDSNKSCQANTDCPSRQICWKGRCEAQ